jgi:hypothetical protein
MAARHFKEPPGKNQKWRWLPLGTLILITAAAAAVWARPDLLDAFSGLPRLVVDRTDVDLGYRRYDVPARVVFTLSNAGASVLRLKEVPKVIVKAGC